MVVQPMEEIARQAAELMLERLTGARGKQDSEGTKQITLATSIYPGESILDRSGEEA